MILYVSDGDIMELNNGLESLELEEQSAPVEENDGEVEDEEEDAKINIRRSSRKKIVRIAPQAEVSKPKRTRLPDGIDRQIAKIYLTKNFKRKPPSLETIFEEPKVTKDDSMQYTSGKKLRRMINFDRDSSSRNRVKKRQMKAKKIIAKNAIKRTNISMKLFMEKLKGIDDDSDS